MTEHKTVYQNENGVRRTMISDDEKPNRLIVQTEQVMDEILDGIQRDRDLLPMSGMNKLLARIPIEVYERAVHENWDEGDWRKFLNDPANDRLRIWRGAV